MDEKEQLGKIAYEAYVGDAITNASVVAVPWEDHGYIIRQHWTASAKAVVEWVVEIQRLAGRMSEEDIALLVEMVQALAASDLLYDNDVSGLTECHFCSATRRVPQVFVHDPGCLTVRARLIEGTIEAKLRGIIS